MTPEDPQARPRVWNQRNKHTPVAAVYVGRPSKFGNPFSHLTNTRLAQWKTATREEAVTRYREWLLGQPELVAAVKAELRGKDLVCWCAPKACHADVLLEVANAD